MILDRETAKRLAKVCALFSSDKLGERAAAAAMADSLLKAKGLTWGQVFAPESADSFAPLIAFAIAHQELLDDWQLAFVHSIKGRQSLSEKQLAKLNEIVGIVRAQVEDAA